MRRVLLCILLIFHAVVFFSQEKNGIEQFIPSQTPDVVLPEINPVKEVKRVITDRLKDYRRDVSVLLKCANEKQQQKIKDLGFDFSELQRGLNVVASPALDIVMKTKDNQLTNIQLYNTYVKSLKSIGDAVNYTEFNIKCRSLINTQRLLRKKDGNPKTSHEDIISLNGRVLTTSLENQVEKNYITI